MLKLAKVKSLMSYIDDLVDTEAVEEAMENIEEGEDTNVSVDSGAACPYVMPPVKSPEPGEVAPEVGLVEDGAAYIMSPVNSPEPGELAPEVDIV